MALLQLRPDAIIRYPKEPRAVPTASQPEPLTRAALGLGLVALCMSAATRAAACKRPCALDLCGSLFGHFPAEKRTGICRERKVEKEVTGNEIFHSKGLRFGEKHHMGSSTLEGVGGKGNVSAG